MSGLLKATGPPTTASPSRSGGRCAQARAEPAGGTARGLPTPRGFTLLHRGVSGTRTSRVSLCQHDRYKSPSRHHTPGARLAGTARHAKNPRIPTHGFPPRRSGAAFRLTSSDASWPQPTNSRPTARESAQCCAVRPVAFPVERLAESPRPAHGDAGFACLKRGRKPVAVSLWP